jgi:hypothetical protein
MNEQLQIELARLVGMLNEGAEKVAEFGAEQIPIVLQQLLLWHWTASFFAFLFGLAMVVVPILMRNAFKRNLKFASDAKRNGDDWAILDGFKTISSFRHDLMVFINGTLPWVCVVIGLVVALSNFVWLKILLAPNLYLLEYAAGLVK